MNSSVYADAVAAKDVTYGLYTAPVAPSVPGYVTGTPIAETVTADTEIRIPVSLGVGSEALKSIKVMWAGKDVDLVAAKIVTLDTKTFEMVITADSVNSLLEQDAAAAADAKLLPLTMNVFFNGNDGTPDAVITLSK